MNPNSSPNSNSSPPPLKRQDHLMEYLKNHPREVIAYVLLIIGIFLLFFNPIIGGILIGLVAGIYFADDIVAYVMDWKISANTYRFTRHLVGIGVGLAFFISAPAIFLGAAVSIAIKQLFIGQNPETGTKP